MACLSTPSGGETYGLYVMKTPIRDDSLVGRTGEIEVGVVAFIDSTHARIDYLSTDGNFNTAFLPLSVLEVVVPQLRELPSEHIGT